MKRVRTALTLALVAAAVSLGSCASVPPSQNAARIERLVAELNRADEDRLIKLSALPFLLDGETVAREEDLRTLWRNLRAGGFTFADAKIESITPVGPESYKDFAEDPEVAAFFKKHTAPEAATVRLRTGHGTFLLLTGGKVGWIAGIPKLYGFTGPEGN